MIIMLTAELGPNGPRRLQGLLGPDASHGGDMCGRGAGWAPATCPHLGVATTRGVV